jgi:hypothetical protein
MEGVLISLGWLLRYVIYAVIVPIIITYKFIDILWPALLFAIIFSVCMFIVQNRININGKIVKFIICVIVFSVVYFYGSRLCTESYIMSIAEHKYKKEDVFINVDYGKIFYFPLFRYGYRGSSHAHICLGNSKYNWSFRERDFYDAKTTFECKNN